MHRADRVVELESGRADEQRPPLLDFAQREAQKVGDRCRREAAVPDAAQEVEAGKLLGAVPDNYLR